MTRRSKKVARMAAAGAAVAVVTAAGVAERTALAASFTVLAHLHWLWIPAAVLLESASMAAFAIMPRWLLAAGGAAWASNPCWPPPTRSTRCRSRCRWPDPHSPRPSLPPLHPAGRGCPLAGWSLLAGGVGQAAAALVVVGGRLPSGNILVTAAAVLVVAGAAARRPRLRGGLERPAAWTLQQGSRLLRRPATEPRKTIRAWATYATQDLTSTTRRFSRLRIPAGQKQK